MASHAIIKLEFLKSLIKPSLIVWNKVIVEVFR